MHPTPPPSSASRPDPTPSRRKGSTRGRKPPPSHYYCTVSQYPHSTPDPSNDLEVRFAALDTAKIKAGALVAADDLIVRIFDDPRHRLHVSSFSTINRNHHTRDWSRFKSNFRTAFRNTVHLERTALTFTRRMQDQGLVEKDEESGLAFSNLCVRYAQLKYYTSRVAVSRIVLNDKMQSRILATEDIPKGTLMLELGGLMSSDTITSGSLQSQGSTKRKRDDPQYNMFSVVWKGSDRLLLGPARFINHSCNPNSKIKPFPKTNAWGVESSTDILAGEEITVYYGKWYFLPGECACAPCQIARSEPEPEPPTLENPYPTPPAGPGDSPRPRKRPRTKARAGT